MFIFHNFTSYEQLKYHVRLSWAWNKFYHLSPLWVEAGHNSILKCNYLINWHREWLWGKFLVSLCTAPQWHLWSVQRLRKESLQHALVAHTCITWPQLSFTFVKSQAIQMAVFVILRLSPWFFRLEKNRILAYQHNLWRLEFMKDAS